jgi:hypothetical protein
MYSEIKLQISALKNASIDGVASRTVLFIIVLFVGVLSLYLSHATHLSGDEKFYYSRSVFLAQFIISLFHENADNFNILVSQFVDNGWFMPGMSFILTPIHLLFFGEAPLYVVRAYITFINLAIVYLIICEILKSSAPKKPVFLFIAILCLMPYYMFYLGMIWGDLVAAHLAIFLLLYFERKINVSKLSSILSIKESILMGFLVGLILFVRSQYLLLLVILIIRLILEKVRNKEYNYQNIYSWPAVLKTSILIFLTCIVVLTPWHYELNKRFGPIFMTTSFHEGPLFFDHKYRESAAKETSSANIFVKVHRKIISDASIAKRSLREQVKFEIDKLPEKSIERKIKIIQRRQKNFYFHENEFLKRFFSIQDDPDKYKSSLYQKLLTFNTFSWYLLLLLGSIAFFLPAYPTRNNYFLVLSLKGVAFFLTTQPMMVATHGRYYVTLIPIFTLMILLTTRDNLSTALSQYKIISIHNILIILGQIFVALYLIFNIWIWNY